MAPKMRWVADVVENLQAEGRIGTGDNHKKNNTEDYIILNQSKVSALGGFFLFFFKSHITSGRGFEVGSQFSIKTVEGWREHEEVLKPIDAKCGAEPQLSITC